MSSLEIRERLAHDIRPEHRFVRWWRRENDFLDYDLVERFSTSLGGDEEIGGIELLTMEEMWDELQRVSDRRVRVRPRGDRGQVIEWVHRDASGIHTDERPYSAQALLEIFDEETRGNPLC